MNGRSTSHSAALRSHVGGSGTGGPFESAPDPHHAVQFYEDDGFLADVVAQYAGAGLDAGEAVIIIATEAHRQAILTRLQERDGDLRLLTLLDARETLAKFMVEGAPDWDRFRNLIGGLLQKSTAQSGRPQARAYGEMVDLLWQGGNADAAIQLEELWNDLRGLHPFSLLCAYDMSNFHKDAHGAALLQVCQVHSHVIPTERYIQIEDAEERLRQVAQLQQRAQALEAEIAQRKQTEEALREALRQRDDFLSIAGHELKTPLTAAQLLLDSLLATLPEAIDAAQVQGRLVRSARCIERLSRLVEELLDVSRISAGRLKLHLEEFDLGALVREVLDCERDQLAAAGCQVHLSGDEPATGRWDRSRIEQVIANLIANAAKYGGGQPIDLSIEQLAHGTRLMVRDRGIGISPADQQRIFNRFERAAESPSGLGLGLWIARQIVEAHGGTIGVSSEEGKGSTFVVELPNQPV